MTCVAAMRVMLGRKWNAAAYTAGQDELFGPFFRDHCPKSKTPVTLGGNGGWLLIA